MEEEEHSDADIVHTENGGAQPHLSDSVDKPAFVRPSSLFQLKTRFHGLPWGKKTKSKPKDVSQAVGAAKQMVQS